MVGRRNSAAADSWRMVQWLQQSHSALSRDKQESLQWTTVLWCITVSHSSLESGCMSKIQAFCNPSPDMAKKVEEFQHLLAPWTPWTLESLDRLVRIRVMDTLATSMPRSDWWACCTAVHYNKYLQIGTGGYNMLQLWIQQKTKVFLVGRKSNSTQIRSPWRPFEILSPDGVDPDSLKMLAKTTDKAWCRGDNAISSHCNFSDEFLHVMRCDAMWHATCVTCAAFWWIWNIGGALNRFLETGWGNPAMDSETDNVTWLHLILRLRSFGDTFGNGADLYWQVEYVQRCHCCGPTCGYSSISRAIQRDSELTKCECLGANSDKRRRESEAQHAIVRTNI